MATGRGSKCREDRKVAAGMGGRTRVSGHRERQRPASEERREIDVSVLVSVLPKAHKLMLKSSQAQRQTTSLSLQTARRRVVMHFIAASPSERSSEYAFDRSPYAARGRGLPHRPRGVLHAHHPLFRRFHPLLIIRGMFKRLQPPKPPFRGPASHAVLAKET